MKRLVRLPAVVLAAAVMLGPAPAAGSDEAVPEPAGLIPPCTINGTRHDDVLVGTNSVDVICGKRGNDRLKGLGDDDYLLGGKGRDRLLGGDDRDVEFGGDGPDTVKGNAGDDMALVGEAGADVHSGGDGDDYLNAIDGVSGNDSLDGGPGLADIACFDPGDTAINWEGQDCAIV